MKSKLNKYMTRGAMVACTSVLFSCSGDDGAPGAPGADGTVKTLPVAAPEETQLPLSEINAIVDTVDPAFAGRLFWVSDPTETIDIGEEFEIGFQSSTIADITELDAGTDALERSIVYQHSDNEFSVEYFDVLAADTTGANSIIIDFTVLDSQDYSLTGTFVSSGISRPELNINADPADKIPVGTGDYADQAVGVAAQTTTLTSGASTNVQTEYVVPVGVTVVGFASATGDSVVFVRQSAADPDLTRADVDAALAAQPLVVNDGVVVTGAVSATAWTRVVEAGEIVDDAFSGTFRLDMDPSQGSMNAGVNDNNLGGTP